MPIKVICSSCEAGLRVADSAAGKKVKCPKCGAINKVTSDEDAEAAEVPTSVARRSKASASQRNEDDDEPVRGEGKKRKGSKSTGRSKAKSNNGLLIGLGVGGAALVVVVGIVVVIAANSSDPTPEAPRPPEAIAPPKQTAQVKEPNEPNPPEQLDPPIKPPSDARAPGPLERTTTENSLKNIGLAFHVYAGERRHFPPPVIGKGLSWRVAILPEIEQRGLYEKFNLEEPWDSKHNLNVLNTTSMPRMFEPGRTRPGEERKTYLQMFTGAGTCYPQRDIKLRIDAITDGPSNTWLAAEGKKAIEWTRPDELEVKDGKLPPLGGVYGSGFYVLCADGKSHYVIQNQFPPDAILSLLNPRDGQFVAGWPPN